jgi:hypothetical protein
MKRFLVILLFSGFLFCGLVPLAFSQANQVMPSAMPVASLSNQSEISLVTFAPGEELHAAFGHAVIWVRDPLQNIDKAYSYGTFDFKTENFYWKFLKGTLPYSISFNSMNDLVYYYSQIEHRSIKLQSLQLDSLQKNTIYQALETNLLPENKNYRYQFFNDNCATRLRDIIELAAPNAFQWPKYKNLAGLSYRDWMNQYLVTNSWVTLGMNLALGIPSNQKANASESCYLPDNLSLALEMAEVNGQKFADSPLQVYQAPEVEKAGFDWFGPLVILQLLIAILVFLSIKFRNNSRFLYGLDIGLFGLMGLLAWFIFFLATGTDHDVMAWNPASLMLFPFNFPLVIWFARSSKNVIWNHYLSVVCVLFLVGLLWSALLFWPMALAGLPWGIRLFALRLRAS